MKTPLLQRLDRSLLGKLIVALSMFGLILGGWLAVQRYKAAMATLPDDEPRAGPCSLWFVGSSSMHRWTSLHQDMIPWVTHNRGIDNATFADILPRFANAERDGRPAAIILYAGENDIANDVPVRTVMQGLAAFVSLRDRMMPQVPILLLSAKPSPGRKIFLKDQLLYNGAAQRFIAAMPLTHYADITSPLLKDGWLGDNYRADGVHMNEAGYRIWADVVRRRLAEILPRETMRRCAR
jgi:lysophospholipase L1-like esterase